MLLHRRVRLRQMFSSQRAMPERGIQSHSYALHAVLFAVFTGTVR